jgi:DNA phosphorothioation-associated putative methyltransferase
MTYSQFQLPFKAVMGRYYVHVDAFERLPPDASARLSSAETFAKVTRGRHFNVARFDNSNDEVTLLNYPQFFVDAFPALSESWSVNLVSGRIGHRAYRESLNPPVLHRKELLLDKDHPRRLEFEALSTVAEGLGLFRDTTRIGFREQWLRSVRESGYQIVGHELIPIANDEFNEEPGDSALNDDPVARHLTALVRSGFSAPIQALARYGLINESTEVFDYGCGRGDDIRGLSENGITASGWDPYYAAKESKQEADVVNLGFVINVIEDFDERVEALHGAYDLTKRVLAVSAMLLNNAIKLGIPYRDGYRTSRNTFQKYYTQAELSGFIATVLDEEPVAVSPGVFFVFRDKNVEQSFLAGRQRNVTLLRRLERTERTSIRLPRSERIQLKYESNRAALDSLWQTWLSLGREPDKTEVEQLDCLVGNFGSLSRALRFVADLKDQNLLARAREGRISDLSVYLAMGQFAKRKPYKQLETGLQRDVRSLFGGYSSATAYAQQQLFKIGDPREIGAACVTASEQGLGWLEEGRSLQLHTSLIERLPTALRIYVGCGAILYGDAQTADLLKIHIESGKLTLMKFDDFEGQPLPRMIERVKLNLRSQSVDIFQYGEEFEPPYLFFKSRYINEEFSHYPEQLAFDEKLAGLEFIDFSGYGPKPRVLADLLERHRWLVEGFDLVRAKSVPDLDSLCGRYLTYRQLIECGETQRKTHLPNLPQQVDSYNALWELATNVLDPVIEYYGSIKLTYGFCSSDLARAIPGRIAPSLDQHAAHEKNKKARYICERLGAAVDFLVEDEDMRDVVDWISQNVPFDRIYFYGPHRPIHVSFAPTPKNEIIELVESTNGKRIPRVRQSIPKG